MVKEFLKMRKKIFLVTGAGGFIGGALAKRLINDGNKVITIDNFSTGMRSNVDKNVTVIKGNCQNKETINKLKNFDIDAIFHLAGQSSGEISFEDPIYDLETNTASTLRLLNFAVENKCPKFIYASSMSVYGNLLNLPARECSQFAPESFYAVGKIASENYMKIYNNEFLTCTSLRLFNVYGLGQNMENLKQGMISIYLSQALSNNHIDIKGSGKRFRDFIHISDVVNAFVLAEKREGSFTAYNICTGIKKNVDEVINLLKINLKNKFTTRYIEGTKGDQKGIYGSFEKIKNDLNWKPNINFDEGIKDLCERLQDN